MEELEQKGDLWKPLLAYTRARIALGRKGVSLPLQQVLEFKMAHAKARDAVFEQVDWELISESLRALGFESIRFQSKARDRKEYLLHPEKGRSLEQGTGIFSKEKYGKYDISIVVADGLSARAVHNHAVLLLGILKSGLEKLGFSLAPISLVELGRVAISDEIGQIWSSKLVLILIGERPGLSSPDSLGAYLTYGPQVGNTDEKRNCISNIRPEGLIYEQAAEKIIYFIKEAMQKGLSGVNLKEQEQQQEFPLKLNCYDS